MKRLSLKTRLVLLYTVVMVLVICIVLGLLFSISSYELLSNVQNQLEERVSQSFDYVTYEDGRLKFDSDLLELQHGVYLSIYEQDHNLLYGKLPYGFIYDLPFVDGQVRTVSSEGVDYYVLDMEFPVEDYDTLVVRGIVSISEAERNFRYTLRMSLVLFPALVLLSAVCGYFLSRRALSPVSRIIRTVREIQKEQDLSRRIQLGEGRDEIYTLAKTFDSLLDTIEAGVQREKQFTSDVSHELRTPLSVILMHCEALLEEGHLDEETRSQVQVIDQKSRSLTNLVSQLLFLSRADQGRAKVQMEQVDFSELTAMAAEEFSELAAEQNMTLQAQIQPGLFLQGDQTLLIRLWSNLLQNAVNYGQAGGHIWMGAQREGERIRFWVRDDGIGISTEHLPHIWERFSQVDPSRGRPGSSGLGLAMVQWIVHAHHGTISVESAPGKGTTFTCELPVSQV